MTDDIYLCLKDLSYIPFYGDGSNSQEVVDWILEHRDHGTNIKLYPYTKGVATKL